jgi:hypothetical protein
MKIATSAKVQQIVSNDHSVSVTLQIESPKLVVTIVSQGADLDWIKRGQFLNLQLDDQFAGAQHVPVIAHRDPARI